MLKMAAAYHKVGYQTYLQWLVDDGLRKEAGYYGWAQPTKRYVVRKNRITEAQRNTIYRAMRLAARKVNIES